MDVKLNMEIIKLSGQNKGLESTHWKCLNLEKPSYISSVSDIFERKHIMFDKMITNLLVESM